MKKIKDILKIIFLTLAILTMMVSLWGKARAEGMIQSDRNFLHNYFGDGFTDEQWTYIEGVMDSCPYFITFQTTDGTKKAVAIMPYSSYYTYDDIYGSNDLTEPDLEIQISINNVGHNINLGYEYGRLCPFVLGNISSSSIDNPYCYYTFGIGQESTAIGLCVVPRGQWYDDERTWHCRWYYSSRRSITGFDSHAIANWDYDTSFVNCNYNARVIRGSYTITETYAQNVFPTPLTDDRFSIYTTIDNTGMPYLHVDWDESVYPSSGSYNYDSSTIELTIDCDGTSSIYSFNSEDYPTLFPTSGSTYIPFQFLDSVNHILENQLPLSAVLTHVRLVQYAYPSSAGSQAMQSFSTETICDVTLIGEDGTIPDFDELDVEYVDNHISSEDFHTLSLSGNNTILDQSIVNNDLSQVEWLINQYMASLDEDWADVCIAYDYGSDYYTSSDLTLIKDLVDAVGSNFGNVGSVISYLFNVYLDHQNSQYAGTYYHVIDDILYNNAYTQSYDYIVAVNFYNLSSSDAYFDVYIIRTSRYWQHKALMSFNNIQTLLGNINDFTVNTYDLLYNGLYNIAYNSKTYFESALSNDNVIIRYLKSINTNLNNLNNSVTDGFSHALKSFANLHYLVDILEATEGVVDAINDLPQTIVEDLQYLFMPSYDSIAVNFNDYKDSLGVLALPFDASVTVLDAVDDNYSSVFSIDVPAVKFDNHTFYNGTTFTLDVWGYFDDEVLSSDAPSGKSFTMGIKYLIAYSAILGCAFFTYCHIFRRFGEENED